MLTSLSLENFRSWEGRTTLRTGMLTLLAGANNAGKSSFLGVLKALVQSEQARSKNELLLSGEWVDLGAYDQILPPGRREGGFSVGLTGESTEGALDVVWDFESTEEPSREAARVEKIEALVGDTLHRFERGSEGLTHIEEGQETTAAILPAPASFLATSGPRQGQIVSMLPWLPEHIQSVGPFRAPPERGVYIQRRGSAGPAVGRYGENAAEIAWQQGSRSVEILPPDGEGTSPDRFDRATSRWYSYILDGQFNLRVEELRRYGYKVLIGSSGVDDLTFSQVGFGLSQIWPILVAGLASQPGDLVLVETPEAHLHPGAQFRLAKFLVELSRQRRQVFIETHSEHVLAAVCLGVKDEALTTGEACPERLPLTSTTMSPPSPCPEREGTWDRQGAESVPSSPALMALSCSTCTPSRAI